MVICLGRMSYLVGMSDGCLGPEQLKRENLVELLQARELEWMDSLYRPQHCWGGLHRFLEHKHDQFLVMNDG
jgi:hypothetical protein